MILTNALLKFGFSVIASFTNVVHVPPDAVPTRIEDLSKVIVGHYGSPTDLSLQHRSGTAFGIEQGAVLFFSTPGSYLRIQDPNEIPRFYGKATLSSNEVLELATRTVTALATTTNPIVNIVPRVEGPKMVRGHEIPIYEITWPKPYYRPGFGYFAAVEIDARSGQITSLELHDPSFCNYPLAREISNQVCSPDDPGASRKETSSRRRLPERLDPMPSPAEAERTLKSWLWLCAKLSINPGVQTNLADINWERSFVFTNGLLPLRPRVCVVELQDGTSINSSSDVAFSHVSSDAYFFGNWPAKAEKELGPFRGTINYRWQELASSLERALTERANVPKGLIAAYRSRVEYAADGPLGTVAFKRILIRWARLQNKEGDLGFSAEFDLETGGLKQVALLNPEIIQALFTAQCTAK